VTFCVTFFLRTGIPGGRKFGFAEPVVRLSVANWYI